ncbi:hypothetical protein C3K47_00180 [Solitalea longa]|uniref:Uncharacterized protein n=1 Tax=Solitalea longa TaxID=2079460 RepID=A0A2S5A8V5_9SPHI|nr:hypothetical protein [Solitalea longa]POY38956.1 hypothetical protein C3K47_00180 [Solitalea longa]
MKIISMNKLELTIEIAGFAQIALVIGSLLIPSLLKWKEELSKVKSLIRQIFWTYAAYILATNLSFGLISVMGANELINGSFMAKSITFFILIYWLSRILIQFFYFDRKSVPSGLIFKYGEVVLVILFVALTIIYGYAFYYNLN